VAEEVGQEPIGALHPVDLPDLGPADSARQNSHEHLAQFDHGHLDLFDLKGATLLDEDRCAGFHGSLGWQAVAMPYTMLAVSAGRPANHSKVYDKNWQE
jgi:hypothetical protein